jgi:hypothetical protein
VEVRGKEEILRTLDKQGRLEGLPFMPGMFRYCGKRFRIYKIAHKTCDSVVSKGALTYKSREMTNTVFLENLRCDGASHGGCDAACLIFWREAWLKPLANEHALSPPEAVPPSNHFGIKDRSRIGATLEEVLAGTKSPTEKNIYTCQATQLTDASYPLHPRNLSQYVKDYTSGNTKLGRMFCGFTYVGYSSLANAGLKLGRPLRLLYDAFQGLFGGIPYPAKKGDIPLGKATPVETLNLQPGELVRVKSYKEILTTMDRYNRNRGMYFVADQVPYCGRTFRVAKRIDQIIDERSGRMVKMKTPCIALEGAVCGGRYTDFCLFCPRSTYPYWREIWLERVTGPEVSSKS